MIFLAVAKLKRIVKLSLISFVQEIQINLNSKNARTCTKYELKLQEMCIFNIITMNFLAKYTKIEGDSKIVQRLWDFLRR